MRTYWQSLRQMERSSALFLAGWAAIAFGYFGVQAVLLNLYLLHLGYDPAYIGTFQASGQLVWAITALPAGMVGARAGLRASIIAGFALIILGWSGLLLAEELPAAALGTGLMAGWMVSWVGAALITVNGLPYQMGVTTDANRGYVFSFQQAIMAVFGLLGGLAAGALPGMLNAGLGGTLSEPASYRAVLWLLPLVHIFGLLAMLRARPVALASQGGAGEARSAAPLGIFAFFSLIVLFQSAGDGGVRALFNLYLHQSVNLPTGQIGSIMGAAQTAPLVAALVIPLMLSRMSSGGALGLSTLLMTGAILILTISSTVLPAALGMFFLVLTGSIVSTTRGLFSQEIVEPRWRPMTSALTTVFMALGWSISSAYGGAAVTQVGFHSLFRLGAAVVAVAALVTIAYVAAATLRTRRATLPAAAVPVTGTTDRMIENPEPADVQPAAGDPA